MCITSLLGDTSFAKKRIGAANLEELAVFFIEKYYTVQKIWMDLVIYTYKVVFNRRIANF